MLAKLVINLLLVSNPSFGANGAAIGSVVCHMVAFSIAFTTLRKNIKLNLRIGNFLIKPIIATFIMGVCSYYIYILLSGIIVEKLATIVAIIAAVIIYILAIFALKVFSKEEILTLPMGNKICKVLEKLKIY